MLFVLGIASARRTIAITNPYFVPDDEMRDTLIAAARRGVRVEIMVPGRLENEMVRADQNLVRALNISRVAFVARGLALPLPPDSKAFQAQDSNTDVDIKERDGVAELVGTFPPGQLEFVFRYQVPLGGAPTQRLALPLHLPSPPSRRLLLAAAFRCRAQGPFS